MSTWDEVEIARKENRRDLVLSGAAISEKIENYGVDPELYNVKGLYYLNISDTCLSVLSPDVGNLTNLTALVLHSNKLSNLPSSIGKLTKLKVLDLSRNVLESVPDEIAHLPELSSLNLSSNKLKALPCMKEDTKLSSLNLSCNEFEEFPDVCCSELVHLAEIVLTGNKLSEIPSTINMLPALKTLDVSENLITSVHGELTDLNKLKELNLKGNKLSDRKLKKLVDQDSYTKHILDYIRQHCPRTSKSADGPGNGKGKKGKRGKRTESESNAANETKMESLCNKLQVLHVTDSTPAVIITEDVKVVRSFITCCIIRKIKFTEASFKRYIQLQTKLHDTVCDKRNVATIATHDLAKIPPGNLMYSAKPPAEIVLKPLMRDKDFSGAELFMQLQKEAETLRKEKKRNTYSGIHRFLYLLEGKPVYPCLLDSQGKVISFPPITNSDVTKLSVDTTNIFVEVTSAANLSSCKKVLDTLLQETLNLGIGDQEESSYHSLLVEQVKIVDIEGQMKVVYPSRSDLAFSNDTIAVIRESS